MKVFPTKPQWIKWSMPAKAGYLGAWLGGCGVFVALTAILIGFATGGESESGEEQKNWEDLSFEDALHRIDEDIHKPFEKWFHSIDEGPLHCEEGNRIAAKALSFADQLSAYPDEALDPRETRSMAKHEYLAMLNCWAAAIYDTCESAAGGEISLAIAPSRRVLAEYDTVVALRNQLYRSIGTSQDPPISRKVAAEITDITSWYAARAACILYLNGEYTFAAADSLARQAHHLFPNESDPWIERIYNMRRDSANYGVSIRR